MQGLQSGRVLGCQSLSESGLKRAIVLERIWVCWAWVPGVMLFLASLVFWVDCFFGESFFSLFACLGFGEGPLICVCCGFGLAFFYSSGGLCCVFCLVTTICGLVCVTGWASVTSAVVQLISSKSVGGWVGG